MATGKADGKVVIDTALNNDGFNRGISALKGNLGGLTGTVKKLGKVIAAAFAVKKLVEFGKEAIELGSNVAEVQNVVDVAFGDMAYKIEDFAKTSVKSYGMSQLAAKKTASTYMAMAKGMGMNSDAASDMAISLTGLSGDLASFFNISQEEADTKLKSVFTGETETLKSLGVVMTQTNLKAYAMKNGFDSNIESMDQASLVALRYNYVMDQLSLAHGDFARTSTSWANQTRILSEQWKEFMSIIGQSLITILRPLVVMLNNVVSAMITAANAFNAFITSIFGGTSTEIQQTQQSAASVGGAIADATDEQDALTNAVKKTNKEQKKSLASFDEIHKLSASSSGGSSSGGGGGGSVAPGTGMTVTPGPVVEEGAISKMQGAIDAVIAKAKELAGIFAEGFSFGFGDSGNAFSGILDDLQSIRDTVIGIFTDPDVKASADQFADTLMYSLGAVTGSVASVAVTIASTFVGGVEKYLASNSGRITEWITRMFDINSEINNLMAEFSSAFANVFSAFNSESGQTLVASILQIFYDVFGGALLLAGLFATDMIDCLTSPFVENQDLIREALEGLLEPVASVTLTIANLVRTLVDGIVSLYDEHISPLIDTIKDAWTEWVNHIVSGFNTYIKPVLDEFAAKFQEVVDQYVVPMVEKAMEFIGKLIDIIKWLWENILQPVVSWLIDIAMPIIATVIDTVGGLFNGLVTIVSGAIGGILDILNGLLSFFSGDFAGGLSQIWEGITGIFSAAWEGIKTIFEPVGDFFAGVWDGIKNAFAHVTDWFGGVFAAAWQAVKDVFSTGGEIFMGIVDGILEAFKAVVNAIIDGINAVVAIPFNGINSALKAIRDVSILGIEPFSWIKLIPVPQIPRLAQGAVIPPNKEFLAVLGDQKNGTNIETPLSTMVQAFKQALAEDGGTGGNRKFTLVIQAAPGFARYLKYELDEETTRQGVCLVQGV